MEPGQHGSKAEVLPWKLAPLFPLLRTLLLLRSTGRVCCGRKGDVIKERRGTNFSCGILNETSLKSSSPFKYSQRTSHTQIIRHITRSVKPSFTWRMFLSEKNIKDPLCSAFPLSL